MTEQFDFHFQPTDTTAQKLNNIPYGEYYFHPPTLADGTVLLNCHPVKAEEIRQERRAELRVLVDTKGLQLALQSRDCPPVPFNLGDGTLVQHNMDPRRAFDQPTMLVRTERMDNGGWHIPEQPGLVDDTVVKDCLDVLAERMKVPKPPQAA